MASYSVKITSSVNISNDCSKLSSTLCSSSSFKLWIISFSATLRSPDNDNSIAWWFVGKRRGRKIWKQFKRTEDQQSIDPVDLMNKAFLATLKERYHLDVPKQIRDSKLFQRKSLDHMNERIKEMEATQQQRMTCKKNIQNDPTTKCTLKQKSLMENFSKNQSRPLLTWCKKPNCWAVNLSSF